MASLIGPALAERIEAAGPDDRFEVQIFLRREPLPGGTDSSKPPDRAALVREVEESAERSLKRFLDKIAPSLGTSGNTDPQSLPFHELWRHWINNSIGAEVSRTALQRILEQPDVERVELISRVDLKNLLHGPAEPLPSGPPVLAGVSAIADQVRLVRAPLLWNNHELRGKGVLVAVIDSGIDFGHPDLEHRQWDGGPEFPHHGFNFETRDQPPLDEDGHGTRCAGLIAGDGSSGLATGVAPEATLMALRVGGVEAHVWSAFQFAIERNADIISMSMGWSAAENPDYIGWRQACDLLRKAGVILVCSAGNDGLIGALPVPRNVAAPAVCPPPWLHPAQTSGGRSGAITCGETDLSDRRVTASSCGPAAWETSPFTDYPFQNGKQGLLKPDLCGPGRGSMSCNPRFRLPGQKLHRFMGGTSAAAATVAGCAALLVEAARRSGNPVLPERIQEALEMGAVWIQGQTAKKENKFGSGRIDVSEAYQYGRSKSWWK